MACAKIVNTTKKVEVELRSFGVGDWFFWQTRLYLVIKTNVGAMQFAKAGSGICEALPDHVMVQPVDVTITFSLDLGE